MDEIIKLSKKKRVDVKIHYGLSQDEMCHMYNESKLTLAVAILEPFGMSVIESLACSTPVVAINEAGFRETVSQNITGMLVDREIKVVSETLTKLLKDDELLKKMGEAGRKDVNKRFTWDNTVDKLEKIFYETKKG